MPEGVNPKQQLKRIFSAGRDAKEDGCFSVCLGQHLKKYQARSITVGFKLLCRVIDGKRNGPEGVLKEDALSPGTWHSYVRFLVVCTHNTYMQY